MPSTARGSQPPKQSVVGGLGHIESAPAGFGYFRPVESATGSGEVSPRSDGTIHMRSRLWELEGYDLQKAVYEGK